MVLTMLVASVLGVTISLLLSDRYTAEALLVHSLKSNSAATQNKDFGGLAKLAGVNLSDGTTSRAQVNLAILGSRTLLINFISKNGLKKQLFPERWDEDKDDWGVAEGLFSFLTPEAAPTDQEAVEKLQKHLIISQDDESGIITVAVEWYDPELAATWVNNLVAHANKTLRDRAIYRTAKNIEFLSLEIENTRIETVRSAIFSLIESEMQSKMIANTQPDYAFEILDMALVPERKSAPKRAVICIMFAIMGLIVGVTIALTREYRARLKPRTPE